MKTDLLEQDLGRMMIYPSSSSSSSSFASSSTLASSSSSSSSSPSPACLPLYQVTGSTERVCRVTLTIEAVKNVTRTHLTPAYHSIFFEATIEGKSRKSSQIKGKPDEHGMLAINESFTFDVNDSKTSALLVEVYGKALFGVVSLGHCKSVPISDLLQAHSTGEQVDAQWYDLLSKHERKHFPGKVLMHITARVAQPEQKLNMFVTTWNVGNTPPGNNLSSWIPTDSSYEIIAIGTQECDYPPRAPFVDSSKDWMATLKSLLEPRYKVIHGISRGQMRLAVFVHIDFEKAISDVLDGTEATGVGHLIPNKGGICIAFKFWDTSLCFVNCHLAAHDGQCEARNGNYKEIIGNLRFNNSQDIDILNQFHHVFWLGDVNYRLNFKAKGDSSKTFSWGEVVKCIERKDYQTLFQYDELSIEREAKRALYAFQEGEVTFPPTFKMKRDVIQEYDPKRMPGWCDRILWFSLPGCHADLHSYTSFPEIVSSDHKPVAATFSLTAYALPCNTVDENLEDNEKRWHIQFTALSASNLLASDLSGYSDPYVLFVGPNIHDEVRTKVIYQNLNPVWNPEKDIPTIVMNTFAIDRLEKEYLMVRVTDFDFTTPDDTLGYGVIPLADAVAAFKNKESGAPFSIQLSYRGCPAGTLQGELKLSWEKNMSKKRFSFASSFSGRTFVMKQDFKRSFLTNRMN